MTWIGTRLSLDHKGKKDGETLKADVEILAIHGLANRSRPNPATGARFSTLRSQKHLYMRVSVDWVPPIGKDQILSLGGNAGRGRHHSPMISPAMTRIGSDLISRAWPHRVKPMLGLWDLPETVRHVDGDARLSVRRDRPQRCPVRKATVTLNARLSVSHAPHRASADEDAQHDIELFQAGRSARV